jgi:hypothetical protein
MPKVSNDYATRRARRERAARLDLRGQKIGRVLFWVIVGPIFISIVVAIANAPPAQPSAEAKLMRDKAEAEYGMAWRHASQDDRDRINCETISENWFWPRLIVQNYHDCGDVQSMRRETFEDDRKMRPLIVTCTSGGTYRLLAGWRCPQGSRRAHHVN